MAGSPPTLRRILFSAIGALTIGLGAASLIAGFSDSFPLRLLQGLVVFAAGAFVIGGAALVVMIQLAGWRDPESEQEFEALVERAEQLAAAEEWAWPEEEWTRAASPEREFEVLVRAALDELPLEFHRALEHVAVVISEGGAQHGAYGLYQGDTIAHDHFHERIVIFRDTLLRDFGDEPELLMAQVSRTVRHELAHHLGWDEKGVRGLGL